MTCNNSPAGFKPVMCAHIVRALDHYPNLCKDTKYARVVQTSKVFPSYNYSDLKNEVCLCCPSVHGIHAVVWSHCQEIAILYLLQFRSHSPPLCAAVQVLWRGVSWTSVCSRAVDHTPAETHPVTRLQRQSVSSCCTSGSSSTRPSSSCLVHEIFLWLNSVEHFQMPLCI